VVRRRMGMGFGDVKLLAMMGAWLGGPRTALALFLAVIGGAVYGVGLVLRVKRRAARQDAEAVPAGQIAIPFGTMLCMAGLYCVFLGERTVGWYLRLFP
jgi:leader peptidase (prepilin peptidase)/N-methyltransferase